MTDESTVWSRPRIHFTPESGWMNDPNGLVVVDGIHHLYFQHNPDASVWGNIHWGHATSHDLVTWEEQPIALCPDSLGEIFSGSIVIDDEDDAGFGPGAIVAAFTHDAAGLQSQSLAYSHDGGTTFDMFADNPVLTADEVHFRDPKIIRLAGTDEPFWLMVVAVDRELWFYRSDDLRNWVKTQSYVPPMSGVNAMVEVPDLVEVDGPSGQTHWMLLYSVDPQADRRLAPRHVSYVRGVFNEALFDPAGPARVLDHGPHMYAAMTWSRPERPPAVIAWMNETEADGRSSATQWCGRQTLVRELRLDSLGRLEQHPVLPEPLAGAERHRINAAQQTATVRSPCFKLVVHGEPERCLLTLSGAGPSSIGSTTIEIEHGRLTVSSGGGQYSAETSGGVDGTLVIVDAGSVEAFSADRTGSVSVLTGIGLGATQMTAQLQDWDDSVVEVVELGDTS